MTPSLTSTNNYINFCDSTTLPITNGAQVRDGSCNPAPLGMIVPNAARPSSKFIFPTFGTTWPANQPLVVAVFVENFEGGFRTNSATNYMAAPQQLTEENLVRGYVGIVFEQMSSFTQTNPTNPNEFTLFQALTVRDTRVGGWSTIVESGLPEGIYRVTSFLRAENHQPVLVASSAGGASGDIIYFSVVGEGGAVNGTAPIIPSSVVAPSSSSGTGPRSTAFDSAPTEPGNSSSPAPVNVGAIAGGVVAGIAALCLVVLFVIFFMRRRKASESRLQQLQPRAFDSPYGGSTTSQNPLTGPNTLGSPNASVAPYSLVSSYTASMHSSNPVSASAPPNVAHSSIPVSVPVPANATSANEKRLPRVPVSPDRASVVSAAPSYRTNI
ncbi:hypothetical protein BKA70DRAFT_472013 [Coprinopsis sp. MPI-PUGE-AT-0042]|nr:hypothetical protein BKA70DRAFT_472013 [Coprinopsis sp. MPI-PUGE-AT-0042]